MTRIEYWFAAAVVLPLTTLSGCGCLGPEATGELQGAHHDYRIGNYRDALRAYEEVIPAMEEKGCDGVDLARARAAGCLQQSGRYEEASRWLKDISPATLAPEDRRELLFLLAANSIERGRAEEPHLVGPDGVAETARRKQQATRLYREARRLYEEILGEAPESYEALRGRGEALLRLGLVSEDSQALDIAANVLRRCVEVRPDDRRARFFRGLAVLYGPDQGTLSESSGALLAEALRLDRDGNHDLHVAYFDLYLYLRAFTTPPEARRAAASPAVASIQDELVDLLEAYLVTGRVREGPSGEAELERMRSYVSTYRSRESESDAAARLVKATAPLTELEVGRDGLPNEEALAAVRSAIRRGEPGDYAMAASVYLESARSSRRSGDRIARYRRARQLFEKGGVPAASMRDRLTACYRGLYEALRSSSVQDPLEIEGVLEELLDLEPRDVPARRELAFVLCGRASRARSSLERETVYRRAYRLLDELEREGALELPLHRRRIYERLIASFGDFLPLAVGNRWVYAERNGRTRVVRVKGATPTGFQVEIDTGMGKKREIWRKTHDLFTRYDTDPGELSARCFPIHLPDPDRASSWSYSVGGERFDAEIITSGVTRQTPAGRFTRCITVRLTDRTTGAEFYHDFAPGVGEIRMESESFYYELTEFEVRPSG